MEYGQGEEYLWDDYAIFTAFNDIIKRLEKLSVEELVKLAVSVGEVLNSEKFPAYGIAKVREDAGVYFLTRKQRQAMVYSLAFYLDDTDGFDKHHAFGW
jgi:hypothetical protein